MLALRACFSIWKNLKCHREKERKLFGEFVCFSYIFFYSISSFRIFSVFLSESNVDCPFHQSLLYCSVSLSCANYSIMKIMEGRALVSLSLSRSLGLSRINCIAAGFWFPSLCLSCLHAIFHIFIDSADTR